MKADDVADVEALECGRHVRDANATPSIYSIYTTIAAAGRPRRLHCRCPAAAARLEAALLHDELDHLCTLRFHKPHVCKGEAARKRPHAQHLARDRAVVATRHTRHRPVSSFDTLKK